MQLPDLRTMIAEHPDRGGLPVELVMAVCMKESTCFEGHFYRYEKTYRWLYGNPTDEVEIIGQKSSWGPMQVMGATARELGLTGPFEELFRWHVGVKYGMLYLRKLAKKYHNNWADVAAAYNAGQVVKENGQYRNASYVKFVMEHMDQYSQPVPLKETEV